MPSSFIDDLKKLVGDDYVLTSPEALAPYLIDTRKRYHGAARCIVRPATTAEVARVVAACAKADVPIVAQGGNTSHCGASIPNPDGSAVLLQLARLNQIRAVDAANNTITVEAGCLLKNVQEAANDAERLFPLSLAAEGSCQIGGNLSTNAGGVQVLRYGNTRELCLGLEVVLPSGEIWSGLRGLRKDNTGYDLKQLFIGAEGTLGIITAAVMKLFPLPKARLTTWLAIDSPLTAVALLRALEAQFGATLTACELISELSLSLVLQHIAGAQRPLSPSPWYLLVELSGAGEKAELTKAAEQFLEHVLEEGLVSDAVIAQSADQAHRLWQLRESISEAQKAEGASIKHDISVPISRLPEFINRCDLALAQAFPGIRIVTFGHVGDGNLHYNQSMPSDNAAFMVKQADVSRLVHDLVHEFGGSISAEHGVGQLKRDELLRYKSGTEMRLMHAIKNAFDPAGLMNPGKVLEASYRQ